MYRPILNTISFALVFTSKKAYNVSRKIFFSIKLKQKFLHVFLKLKNLFNKKKKERKEKEHWIEKKMARRMQQSSFMFSECLFQQIYISD